MLLITAFLLGLLGSIHCVGMCGPIALALPIKGNDILTKFLYGLLYNMGRIFTYASLGLIMGFAGKGLAFAGLQQSISIGTGLLIISFVLAPKLVKNRFTTLPFLNKFISGIKSSFSNFFNKRSFSALFMIGLLNGFLPCGLVYAALLGAVSSGNPYSGIGFMVLFGLGTMPLMMVVIFSKTILSLEIRKKFNKLFPAMALALGVLLFVRGLNLGIPYISPEIEQNGAIHRCH